MVEINNIKFYNTDDLVVMFGIDKNLLSTARTKGKLAYYKLGKLYYHSEADIMKWLESCRVVKEPQPAN